MRLVVANAAFVAGLTGKNFAQYDPLCRGNSVTGTFCVGFYDFMAWAAQRASKVLQFSSRNWSEPGRLVSRDAAIARNDMEITTKEIPTKIIEGHPGSF